MKLPTEAQREPLAPVQDSHITQAIDFEVLDQLARIWEGRPGIMDRVIKLFLETALECVKELETASATGDVPRLYRASHALKPYSAVVGASVLTAHYQELEAMARTGVVPDAAPRVRLIEEDYRRAAAALRSRLRELATP